jgi:hypothetical protein
MCVHEQNEVRSNGELSLAVQPTRDEEQHQKKSKSASQVKEVMLTMPKYEGNWLPTFTGFCSMNVLSS